jgi:L-ascorbate metabolism protein UlaG (beta-lactamase superfamily)
LTQVLFWILLVLSLVACGRSTSEGGQVALYYEEAAQVELISPRGTRVLIDVFDPSALSRPATDKDVLLTTHGHDDHFQADFADSFPGQQLRMQEGEIDLSDVRVRGIASSHSAAREIKSGLGNYIFIVDMGGLRIAHFGDIGQEQLTQEQLEALGEVDIGVTQLVNSFSQMNMRNKKGFNLMAQVQPKLIVPTHGNGDMEAIEYAMELWEVVASDAVSVTVSRSDLADGTKMLVLGEIAPAFKKIYDLPEW